ncbi:MAG: glycosyltransferase family 2 protein [Sphingomonadales bacterium]|nr:glycosyltransferase family 2 protein [Sphingomonadales bacterium]
MLNFIKRASSKIAREYRDYSVYEKVRDSLILVSGPKFLDLPEGKIAVVLMGRNMEHYLEHFHDHHRAMGADYFVYCDNGSTDRSLDIVSKWKNTVALSTDLNFRDYQIPIRQQITHRYCSDGWRLAIDPDELFDYVGADRLSLPELARSVRERGYTGVVAQMLDMVPDADLASNALRTFEQSAAASKYFSLDQITSLPYSDSDVPFSGLVRDNTLPDVDIEWKFGGLRRQYFGEDCCLTKHALYYHAYGVRTFVHPHLSTGLKLADFTALLRHYKFSGDFLSREAERIANNRISHNETELRADVMGNSGEFRFDVSKMDTDSAPEVLIDRGFLVMSEDAKSQYG